MMAIRKLTLLAAIAALTLPTLAGAQTGSVNAADAPILWGARVVEYAPAGLTLRTEVELLQGPNRFRADEVRAATADGAFTEVQASGNVYYVTPTQTMRGDRAVYTVANDTIVVTGDVILTQGENVMTGTRIVYNVRTEAARIEGGQGGRVQGVFYPNRGSN